MTSQPFLIPTDVPDGGGSGTHTQDTGRLDQPPNAGGVLVLGLGCENSNIEELKRYIGSYDPKRVRFLVAQESEDEIRDGLAVIRELAEYAGSFSREPISCRELVIGMKCGGSDGLSGITANPTVGGFSDLLISKGGTTILTEVPEMFGAETLLMNRCANEALFDRTVELINDFKNYFKSHNQTIYENPSPGNKKRDLHAGRQIHGMHTKIRQRACKRCSRLRGTGKGKGSEPAQRPGQ